MKSLKFKFGVVVIVAILAIAFFQMKNYLERSYNFNLGFGFLNSLSNTATATTSFGNPSAVSKKNKNGEKTNKKINANEIVPLGINNPFSYADVDVSGENCLKNKSVLMLSSQTGRSYSEAHIEKKDLKKCLPVAVSYMNNIKDMGVNVISQHFTRRYDENGMPYFGYEERNNETAIQLYVNEFGNYFWAAVNPASSKGFIGDIDIETHKILTENKNGKKFIYLPASEAGFAEWQKWLSASLDYLKDHNALDRLAYFQIGNESDGDYAKTNKIERDNRNDFYWSAYAKLVEKSYNIIRSKSPKTKISIGAMGAGGVTTDGFQRPVLEYLAGKIDDSGLPSNETKRCGGSGCFDVYDYHDFSGYKEYKGRTACQPRDCVSPVIVIQKTPEYMNKPLGDIGLSDKKLVIQQGGTYTGQDGKVERMEEYQTEEDQASYLIKRNIYLLANGAEQIQSGTYIEHSCYDGTIHNWFTMMGFVYNGLPKEGGDDCSQSGKKNKQTKQEKKKALTAMGSCDGQSPCPDPGKGVKKLSYFSYKKLIEILKDGGLNKIEKIPSETNDVYVFKTTKNNGKENYFVWWDWWNKCPRPDFKKQEMDIICINSNKPSAIINVGKNITRIRTTEIVPNQDTGKLADKMNYKDIFTSSYEDVKEDGNVAIKLGTKPIYIETDVLGLISTKKASKQSKTILQDFPFGISNPYDQKDLEVKAKLPAVLKDLGLSKDENGVAGFIVDEIARKHAEEICNDTACQKYDFTLAKDLIDLVVGQGKANLWIVLGTPSNYKFTDGKIRGDGKTYLPDGPISRQAYKDYLSNLVNFVNSHGKKVSGDSDWRAVSWNIYNEVSSEYKDTFENDIDKATEAYANLVIDSSEILRKLSPQSEIVLAGAGSGTDLRGGHGEFYKQVFSKIKQANLGYNPFDYWESHWFGEFKDYKANEKGYGAKDFIKSLQGGGYNDKGFVIRAGATYSGQDLQERKGLMNNYQSEQDQANFLVKRFVYNIANGAKKIAWSTVYERDKYQGERNVHFQYVSLIYDGYPDGVSKKQECVEGWLPCPDPGLGVKKLSYFSYKKIVEMLKGSDWNNIQTIQEKDGVYVYKLSKNGKPFWVAWNDNPTEKNVSISGIMSSRVKITEAIPKYKSGKEVVNYSSAFVAETKTVSGKTITVSLFSAPIYIETDM